MNNMQQKFINKTGHKIRNILIFQLEDIKSGPFQKVVTIKLKQSVPEEVKSPSFVLTVHGGLPGRPISDHPIYSSLPDYSR